MYRDLNRSMVGQTQRNTAHTHAHKRARARTYVYTLNPTPHWQMFFFLRRDDDDERRSCSGSSGALPNWRSVCSGVRVVSISVSCFFFTHTRSRTRFPPFARSFVYAHTLPQPAAFQRWSLGLASSRTVYGGSADGEIRGTLICTHYYLARVVARFHEIRSSHIQLTHTYSSLY